MPRAVKTKAVVPSGTLIRFVLPKQDWVSGHRNGKMAGQVIWFMTTDLVVLLSYEHDMVQASRVEQKPPGSHAASMCVILHPDHGKLYVPWVCFAAVAGEDEETGKC